MLNGKNCYDTTTIAVNGIKGLVMDSRVFSNSNRF